MFGHFDLDSLPPELKMIFNEMKKMADEAEALRARVAVLEAEAKTSNQKQEALRQAINKVSAKAGESPKYGIPSDPKGKGLFDSLFG